MNDCQLVCGAMFIGNAIENFCGDEKRSGRKALDLPFAKKVIELGIFF